MGDIIKRKDETDVGWIFGVFHLETMSSKAKGGLSLNILIGYLHDLHFNKGQ